MVMNFSNEAWALEFEDGTQMRGIRSSIKGVIVTSRTRRHV